MMTTSSHNYVSLEPLVAVQTGDRGCGDPVEPRVAKVEADVSHCRDDIMEIKEDIKQLRIDMRHLTFAGFAGLSVVLSALALCYFRLDDKITAALEQVSQARIAIERLANRSAPRPLPDQTK
jgi:hypothetical protein